MSKAFPCGAGLGLMGVATDGDVALCHRFAGSDAHKLGTVAGGIDRNAQHAFLEKHHIANKTDCSHCWPRAALFRRLLPRGPHALNGGDGRGPTCTIATGVRGWTDVCLQIYGELVGTESGVSRAVRRADAGRKGELRRRT
jgi:uncharacterized protein